MGVWHTYSTRQTLSELETDKSRGLSGAEAERRLARWGPNRLEEGRRQGLLLRFLGQMKDPMILVLLAAAALSLWASGGEDWLDAAIILVIVVVNACISISQEDSAEKALEALRKMSAPLAKVVRDGALQRLETDRLVPGDIIHLEAGDLVPADARILEAASLQADESAMTGESVPVSKGLLSALPEDTRMFQILHARSVDLSRLEGAEREHYARMKEMYALPSGLEGVRPVSRTTTKASSSASGLGNDTTRAPVRCPLCGHPLAVWAASEAHARGLWVKCKNPACKREVEIKL